MDYDNDSNTWHRFGGLLAPKATLSYPFDTMDKPYLSLLSMLIPTNDAFVGMDSIEIPTEPGTYTYYLNAYDAGTELIDELNSARTDVVEAGTGNALGGYGVPGVAGGGGEAAGYDVVRDDLADAVRLHQGVVTSANADDPSREGLSTSVLTEAHRFDYPTSRAVITRTR
ncbi:hypothetical protein ALT1644_60072 [Alteromonas macleodii]|uniref:spondin domain-containing protein n=1 Tax=Alteromonas sp. BZK5 TaxID=1904459 RepID=UPI003976AD5B